MPNYKKTQMLSGVFSLEVKHYALSAHAIEPNLESAGGQEKPFAQFLQNWHKSVNARGSHCVNSQQSAHIIKHTTTFIPVGSRKFT